MQKFLEGANVKLGSWLSDIEGKSSTELLELIIGKPDFTVEDVSKRMHGRMKSTAEELFLSLGSSITPAQSEFFAHVMAVIRQQTAQIEKTGAMIQNSLNENYKTAIAALDDIPGIGRISAEQIIAETSADMSHFKNRKRRFIHTRKRAERAFNCL